ncbi:MAG: hypothetical protein KKA73_06885 [Chloroflexi bacterium]|nr:hypothetical protein [Chloroflexota bacterium]MBU1747397.1 hypothetical protein [Chloroflexota bacterium]
MTPTAAVTGVPAVYLTHTVTSPVTPTISLPLSPLPFGTLLFSMGQLGRPEEENIYTLAPQGQRLWMADHMAKGGIRLSPDGKQVAYVVVESAGESIWIAHPDGTAARRLTPAYPRGGDVGHYLFLNGWSADSQKYAYTREYQYDTLNRQFYIVNVTSGTIRPIGEKGGVGGEWDPRKADELLFWPRQDNTRLCLLDVRTGDCAELGGDIPRLRREDWEVWGFTPDGDGFYVGRNGNMIITDRAGLIQRKISVNARIGAWSWSRDGQRFLIGIYDERQLTDIYIMGSQAANWRKVVSRQAFWEPGDVDNTYLNLGLWSPDGEWFLVYKHRLVHHGGNPSVVSGT